MDDLQYTTLPDSHSFLIIISSSIKSAGNQRLNLRGKAFIISAQLNIDEVIHFFFFYLYNKKCN